MAISLSYANFDCPRIIPILRLSLQPELEGPHIWFTKVNQAVRQTSLAQKFCDNCALNDHWKDSTVLKLVGVFSLLGSRSPLRSATLPHIFSL